MCFWILYVGHVLKMRRPQRPMLTLIPCKFSLQNDPSHVEVDAAYTDWFDGLCRAMEPSLTRFQRLNLNALHINLDHGEKDQEQVAIVSPPVSHVLLS